MPGFSAANPSRYTITDTVERTYYHIQIGERLRFHAGGRAECPGSCEIHGTRPTMLGRPDGIKQLEQPHRLILSGDAELINQGIALLRAVESQPGAALREYLHFRGWCTYNTLQTARSWQRGRLTYAYTPTPSLKTRITTIPLTTIGEGLAPTASAAPITMERLVDLPPGAILGCFRDDTNAQNNYLFDILRVRERQVRLQIAQQLTPQWGTTGEPND